MDTAYASILLELDSKLSKFAAGQQVPDPLTLPPPLQGVSDVAQGQAPVAIDDEFLRLLLRGIPSMELENFLARELTTRKLKKLWASVESSYSAIQELILECLHQVVDALMFRLGDLKGLARWTVRVAVAQVS